MSFSVFIHCLLQLKAMGRGGNVLQKYYYGSKLCKCNKSQMRCRIKTSQTVKFILFISCLTPAVAKWSSYVTTVAQNCSYYGKITFPGKDNFFYALHTHGIAAVCLTTSLASSHIFMNVRCTCIYIQYVYLEYGYVHFVEILYLTSIHTYEYIKNIHVKNIYALLDHFYQFWNAKVL